MNTYSQPIKSNTSKKSNMGGLTNLFNSGPNTGPKIFTNNSKSSCNTNINSTTKSKPTFINSINSVNSLIHENKQL